MILRVGSSGDNVLDLQNKLKNLGYTIDADSVYGSQTKSVVEQFQKDYGLDVDGVAGDQTFGKLNSLASNTGTQAEQKAPAVEPVSVQPYQKSDEVKNAYALIEQHKQSKPGAFSWGNQSALDKAYEDWKNRESFSYDPSSDPLYQLYKDQYAALGKIAMEDTMGQAAALTGGYGNSWAQTVGQQTYNNYMQQVNSMLPEFYGMAKQNYDEEGQKLLNELSILEGQRQTAYGEHRDMVGDWQNELSYLVGTASDLEDKEYQQYRDTVADDRYLSEMDHERQQEAFERLTGLISVGYQPTDADLLAAGMTRAQADALTASFTSGTDGKYVGEPKEPKTEDTIYDQIVANLKGMKAAEPKTGDGSGDKYSYTFSDKAYEESLQSVLAYLDELVSEEIITENEKSALYNKYVSNQL